MTTVVYTDGACLGNPGPGGWAWAVPEGPFASGARSQTTNQQMEILAALEAVEAIEGPLEVVSDSTYVVNCFRDRWWEGWLARGWLNSQRKPVANRELWEPLVNRVRERGDVTFRWVKGHGGDVMNDLVDRLAVEAARTQAGRSGVGWPEGLGPADETGAVEAVAPRRRDHRLPPGRLVVVTGHRPLELGGYEENPVAQQVRRQLTEILSAKQELHPDLVVLTGLGLGAEQLGAEAALDAGVPYLAVLAYPDFDGAWSREPRQRFARLADQAESRIVLQGKRPANRQQAGAALSRRDAWLCRHADEAIVVWDGRDDRIGKFLRSLQDRLGDDVWTLPPPPA